MLEIIFSLNTLWWLILLLYIPACFGLIIIVLLQKGKGQGLAGVLGMGGGMDTIFGPRSSKSLPQKITYISAGIFMALALIMSILSGRVGRSAAPELVEVPQASMDALFDPSQDTAAVNTLEIPAAPPIQVMDAGALDAGAADTPAANAGAADAGATDTVTVIPSESDTPAE